MIRVEVYKEAWRCFLFRGCRDVGKFDMFASLFLTLVASATAALAGPLARAGLRRQTTTNDCPGYSASNVVKTDSTLTADLKLAGTACNAYGQDLDDLKLLVEYQTSKL
jgi:alpha-glucosidase